MVRVQFNLTLEYPTEDAPNTGVVLTHIEKDLQKIIAKSYTHPKVEVHATCGYTWYTMDRITPKPGMIKHECHRPSVRVIEQKDSPYPEQNGPLPVCEVHISTVEKQNEVNAYLASGQAQGADEWDG